MMTPVNTGELQSCSAEGICSPQFVEPMLHIYLLNLLELYFVTAVLMSEPRVKYFLQAEGLVCHVSQ